MELSDIHIELSANQRAALKAALRQVVDGQQVVLTADGVELAAMIPMGDLDLLEQVEDALDGDLIDEARAAGPYCAEAWPALAPAG